MSNQNWVSYRHEKSNWSEQHCKNEKNDARSELLFFRVNFIRD